MTRVRSGSRAALLAALCGVFLALAVLAWPYDMDDAYISLRYAEHLAAGRGLVWNPGDPPVEGYSNFLWVVWMALAAGLPAAPLIPAKALGLACGAATILLLAREGRDLLGEGWPGLFPAACLALSPMFAFWAVSGIEMPAFALALLAAVRGLRRGRALPAGLAAAAASLLRPEGALLAGVAGAVLALGAARRGDRAAIRGILGAGAIALALFAPYQIWRWAYFGGPLANTVQAKWQPLGGVGYFLWDLGYYEGVHLLLAAALPVVRLVFPSGRSGSGSARGGPGGSAIQAALGAGAALLAVQAAILANTRPAMGFYLRLFWPALPFLFLLSGACVARLAVGLAGSPAGRALIVALPAAVLAAFPLARDAAAVRRTALAVEEILATVHGPAAEWLRERHPGATVAMTDCGLIPWRTDAPVIDLWGLNDPEIAREGFDADRVLARDPRLLVLASTDGESFSPRFDMDGALQAHPRVADGYRLVRRFVWRNDVDRSGDYALWIWEKADPADGPASEGGPG